MDGTVGFPNPSTLNMVAIFHKKCSVMVLGKNILKLLVCSSLLRIKKKLSCSDSLLKNSRSDVCSYMFLGFLV